MSSILEVTKEQYPELVKLRRQDTAIAELAEKFSALTITGIDDREGYEAVHKARMVCVKTRTGIENIRKELKADALEYGRRVDAEAKRITALLEPIENRLVAQQKAVDDAKAAIARKREEEAIAAALVRVDQLAKYGCFAALSAVRGMTDEQFQAELNAAKSKHEAEQQRKAEEAERIRKEDEARAAKDAELKAKEAELARIEAEQKAERAKAQAVIDEANRIERERLAKIEAEQRAEAERLASIKREAEAKQAIAEAAERARLTEIKRIELEKEEEQRRQEAKRIADEKAEAEKPYREKLLGIAKAVDDLLDKAPAGPCGPKLIRILSRAAKEVRELAQGEME